MGPVIPCRGGGTSTTYYTDMHNVDEDVLTTVEQGGRWTNGTSAGVVSRSIEDDPVDLVAGKVASRLIYLS